MILGVGIDIIEVERIKASFERFGERFLSRILHPSEIKYCLSHRAPAPFLAARFAGKEAISKAFGTGIGAQLGWQDMEIGRKDSGEPIQDRDVWKIRQTIKTRLNLEMANAAEIIRIELELK